ncbi:MAG: hypothetical protein JWP19_2781 [Rhodoglobus sp.]|nr:hypothetical protein [Rhodoglobus sp.]
MTRLLTPEELSAAVGPIRSYDAVIVVGAGMSTYGFPMTQELPALVWQGIDASPRALTDLRERSGRDGTAKGILAADSSLLALCWALIRTYPDARAAFQAGFANLDADRDPSQAHVDLARLIHAGHVECVVSFNWDTCLERAHKQTFGVPIRDGVLFKPHGDAAVPTETWVLPDEGGVVDIEILDKIQELSDRPRTLTVIGYSASDEAVVEILLAPLAARWPVVRVGPSATGEGALPVGAETALRQIVDALGADAPLRGWRYVTFDTSRDLSAALRGERLRPVDVNACPELPAAERLSDRLTTSKFATVSGASGSGKSITAFHAGRRMNQSGWAVVERRGGVTSPTDITEFRDLEGPVLAIVDDAQALDVSFLEDLRAQVDDDHAVLLVSTVRLEERSDETVVASQAQQVIYDYCREHIDDVGNLISSLDDRVQWSAFALETPERRLEVAKRSTESPWLFMFVASGGDRRVSGAIDRLLDHRPSVICFAWICLLQMVSRDAGSTRDELRTRLREAAPESFLQDADFLDDVLEDSLGALLAERLVTEQEGRLRAVHIRLADRALYGMGLRREHGLGTAIMGWARGLLVDPSISLSGKLWLFRIFNHSEPYRRGPILSLAQESVAVAVLDQIEDAPSGMERGAGLNLAWSLDFIHTFSDGLADRLAHQVAAWLPELQSDEVNGFHWILSGLRSSHESAYEMVRTTADARALAQSFSRLGTRPRASDWGDVIRELAPRWDDPRYEDWIRQFEEGIDETALIQWVSDVDADSHPFEMYELISDLAELSPEVATAVLRASAQNLIEKLESDLADAPGNFAGWVFGIMLPVARLADAPTTQDDEEDEDLAADHEELPETSEDVARREYWQRFETRLPQLSAAVLEIMRSVDWEASAESLRRARPHEIESLDLLLFWLANLSTDISDRIAAAFPFDWLYAMTVGDPPEGPRNFARVESILRGLAGSAFSTDKVRAFLEAHESEILEFPPRLITVLPQLGARRILGGRPIGARSPSGDWTAISQTLERLETVNADAARIHLRAGAADVRAVLASPHRGSLRGFSKYVQVADRLDEAHLTTVFAGLTVAEVREGWTRAVSDASQEMAPLLERARESATDVSTVARDLLSERPN